MKLKDKVAVITGGNSGIGFGIARAFRSEGAIGAITGRNQDTLNISVQELGREFVGINANVNNLNDLDRIFGTTAEKFNRIDILVVNAGGIVDGVQMGSVEEIGEDSFDKFIDLNLKSVYFTVQKALPYMNDGGSIILIGSVAAYRAAQGMSIYSAAKAAVISFARGFSLDLLQRRIRVNVISPGPIDTPVFNKMVPEEHLEYVKQRWAKGVPAGRLGLPADVGNAAVFLASEDSAFMLGNEIRLDGGMTNIDHIA